jgi:hypothetical protein
MAIVKHRITDNNRAALEDAFYDSRRTDGIGRRAATAAKNARDADRYASGEVDGVSVATGRGRSTKFTGAR